MKKVWGDGGVWGVWGVGNIPFSFLMVKFLYWDRLVIIQRLPPHLPTLPTLPTLSKPHTPHFTPS